MTEARESDMRMKIEDAMIDFNIVPDNLAGLEEGKKYVMLEGPVPEGVDREDVGAIYFFEPVGEVNDRQWEIIHAVLMHQFGHIDGVVGTSMCVSASANSVDLMSLKSHEILRVGFGGDMITSTEILSIQ